MSTTSPRTANGSPAGTHQPCQSRILPVNFEAWNRRGNTTHFYAISWGCCVPAEARELVQWLAATARLAGGGVIPTLQTAVASIVSGRSREKAHESLAQKSENAFRRTHRPRHVLPPRGSSRGGGGDLGGFLVWPSGPGCGC